MNEPLLPNTCSHLNRKGGATSRSWNPAEDCADADSLIWLHLRYTDAAVRQWLPRTGLLETPLLETLLDDESRPRVLHHEDGLFLTLRGVNLNPGAEPEDMVSIRMWIDENRIISTRKRRLRSVLEIRDRLEQGRGPASSGEFLVMLLDQLTTNIGSVIEDLQDRMAEVEENIIDQATAETRQLLAGLRRQSIALRRYLGPQREALMRLSQERVSWMSMDDHYRIRETTDELIRHLEDLDAVRERAALAHEEVVNQFSEQLNQRMLTLSVVTAVFLPLGFLTGLFGINVGGIPGAENPWGFSLFCLVIGAVVAGSLWIFKRNRWL